MVEKKILGVIPARYASTRFPGKPLVKIGGKMMIERVYEQVINCVDEVCVATDDDRIFAAVEAFGGRAVMTSEDHKSGTDRCCEALQKSIGSFDIVVNIQGDEPFIQPEQIELLISCFESDDIEIATLVKAFSQSDTTEALFNANTPKVIFNKKMEAIYFSRSVIPFVRGIDPNEWLRHHIFYKHIGLYAYRSHILKEITQLTPSTLELIESLEQLRWLENNYKIKVAITNQETIGIDTPDDLIKAEHFFSNNLSNK